MNKAEMIELLADQEHAAHAAQVATSALIMALKAEALETAALRARLAKAEAALRGIWPFVEEDSNFATPEYRAAIKAVRDIVAGKEQSEKGAKS